LKEFIIKNYSPQLAVVFGSYSLGEDVEESDIDILILTKGKKDIFLQKFEKILKREINLIVLDNLTKLDKPLIKKVYNGFVICGGFDG
jgi:predicted nucleotidyltransferase